MSAFGWENSVSGKCHLNSLLCEINLVYVPDMNKETFKKKSQLHVQFFNVEYIYLLSHSKNITGIPGAIVKLLCLTMVY